MVYHFYLLCTAIAGSIHVSLFLDRESLVSLTQLNVALNGLQFELSNNAHDRWIQPDPIVSCLLPRVERLAVTP